MNYNEQQQPQPIYTQILTPHYENQPQYYQQYPQQQQTTPTTTIPSTNQQPLQSYDPYSVAYTTQPTHYVASYDVGTNGLASYYHDPNWASPYGVTPLPYSTPNNNIVPTNGVQQYAAPSYDVSQVKHPAHLPRRSKKRLKTPNICLSVRCDVCNILCDTQDVLEKHRSGKKHKKNLEKLKASVAAAAPVNPVTSGQETPDTSKSGSKKKATNPEDLERKRRRVLDGGTAVDSVRMCTICNVVCNSETVFQAHLAGKMHASKLKKQGHGTQQVQVLQS